MAAELSLETMIASRVAERVRGEPAPVIAPLERIERRQPLLLLSLDEAARVLGIGHRTAKRLVARGEVRATRIGRSVRVDITAVRSLSHEEVTGLAAGARGP